MTEAAKRELIAALDRMIAEDDRAIARFEDEGAPPLPIECGAVDRVYGLVCDREHGHAGNHRGYLEQHDEVLFWPAHRRQGSWTGSGAF